MPLRLIEAVLPTSSVAAIDQLVQDSVFIEHWTATLSDEQSKVCILLKAEYSQELLDAMVSRFSSQEAFRIVVLPVEATLPRPPEPDNTQDLDSEPAQVYGGISREELFDDITQGANFTPVFVAQTVLATVVAAVGLIRNDTPVIIGAMVIAPLLGPNVALCLATTLGDLELALRSVRTNAIGLSVALVASVSIGLIFTIDTSLPSIAGRTQVHLGDIVLGLASGCAGVLAFTTGVSASLIGVMVAVALLPPFTTFGLLLANGEWQAAVGAILLVATNVICVNLAGVLTFTVQGIRPRTWWETKRARRATWIAATIWTVLLVLLLGILYFANRSNRHRLAGAVLDRQCVGWLILKQP